MRKLKDLGTVVKRHCSGMMETKEGNKLPAYGNVEIGDQLVQEGTRKFFVKKAEWVELKKPKRKAKPAVKDETVAGGEE